MDKTASQNLCVVQSNADAILELGFATGQAGQAVFTGRHVAGRCVKHNKFQVCSGTRIGEFLGRVIVRKLTFDGFEAQLLGGVKPIKPGIFL